MSEATQRDTGEVKDWYRTHETKSQIGFDPDGMCLAICRTARLIAPKWPSALVAQINTPEQYRVHRIADIKPGMIGFFDDPTDGNPFGHIVTFMARLPDKDPDSLSSLVTRTNSVKSDMIVPVMADYFGRFWGDSFQFAATYLNGEPFYDMQDKPKPKPPKRKNFINVEEAIASIREGIDELDDAIKHHEKAGNDRYVKALKRGRRKMVASLKDLRDSYEKNR